MKADSNNLGLINCADEAEVEILIREAAKLGLDEIWLYDDKNT